MKLEYTDAPVAQPEPGTGDKMPCPYCGHLLPKDAERCDRCDWVRGATQTAEGKASDAVAVMFSIVPGLGHIYKGHILAGLSGCLAPSPWAFLFSLLRSPLPDGDSACFSSIWPRQCFTPTGSTIASCRRKKTKAKSIRASHRYIVDRMPIHESRFSNHHN